MEDETNYVADEELSNESSSQQPVRQPKNRVEGANKAAKGVGTGMQAAGKTAKVAGTGVEYAGKAAKYAGKGLSSAGNAMTQAGSSLSSTGIGAIAGVPLAALGALTTGAGKVAEVGGTAAEQAGKATKQAGKKIDETGKNIKNTAKKSNKINNKTINISGDPNNKKLIIGVSLGCAAMGFLIVFCLLVVVLLLLGVLGDGSKNSSTSGYIFDSECNFEETTVTVMDGTNTEVLATVSLEDYIIGVACVEIGACGGASRTLNENYVKAQYVASKTYALVRGNYDSATKNITVKASTRDQQWCDLKNGCIITKETNSIYHNSYPGNYPTSKLNGFVTLQRSFTTYDLETFHRYYDEIYGELYISTKHDDVITTFLAEDSLGYKASTQNYWRTQADAGKTYVEILDSMPTSGVADAERYKNKSIYNLKEYCEHSWSGGTGELVSLENYPDISNAVVIKTPITNLLSNSQIDDLNNYIISEVDKAGYGTGEGVAAAGSALIKGLYQFNYRLPYWYGGGHMPGITIGVDKNWGGSGPSIDPSYINSNIDRKTYSYDCSGFVSWSIKNGCSSSFYPTSSSEFAQFGNSISLSEAKPGDVMVIAGVHVRLVVGNTGTSIIAAESTAGGVAPGGLQFIEYKSAGGYKFIDMSRWYQNNCKNSR